MKHLFSHRNRVSHTKRYLAAIVALLLILTVSATALADSGRGTGVPGGQSRQGGSGNRDGENPQSSAKPEKEPKDKTNGNGKSEMAGVNLDKIREAIATVTDEAVQANLTALLETYESALETKQAAIAANETDLADLTSAAGLAKDALDAALEEAGVSVDDLYGTPEEAEDGTGRMQNRPAMDTDEISAAIAALDDTNESKAALTSLLEAYETALSAQTNADLSSLTNEELKALADAVQAAERELLEATKAAGITGGVGRGQFINGNSYGNAAPDTESIAKAIAALDDTDANKATLTALLSAYEAALAAQNGADTSNMTQEEIDALAEATNQAELALEEALQNAGLSEEPVQEQNERQIQVQTESGDGADEQFDLNVLEGDGTTDDSEPANFFSAFLQWLGSLVQ
ncbi:MAG: hypothetical protein LLF75_05690 [Eubacteriales bacterium]|nr:hypothetical protein [Eubacteriales bacterium]